MQSSPATVDLRIGLAAASLVVLAARYVHVAGHGGTAEFWLGPIRSARVYRYNQRQLCEITRVVREHEQEFLERWHEFCRQAD